MKFYKKIQKKHLRKELINIINGTIELTEREKQVLLTLIQLDEEWRPAFEADYKDVMSTDSRKAVMRETHLHKANLVKYSKVLKDKGLLIENTQGGWEVNPLLTTKPVNNILEITYTIELENENNTNTMV